MTARVFELDARGHRCPTPTLRLRRALAQASGGALIAITADDPMARIDIPHFVGASGDEVVAIEDLGSAVRFLIRKSAASGPATTG